MKKSELIQKKKFPAKLVTEISELLVKHGYDTGEISKALLAIKTTLENPNSVYKEIYISGVVTEKFKELAD